MAEAKGAASRQPQSPRAVYTMPCMYTKAHPILFTEAHPLGFPALALATILVK